MPKGSKGPSAQAAGAPDVRRYAQEMQTMLRRRDPQAYRAFIRKWRDLHELPYSAEDEEYLRLRSVE